MSGVPIENRALRTQKEVSVILGISRAAVQNSELRAIRKLRERLLAFPEIAQWLDEQGIEIDDDEDGEVESPR